MAGESQRDYDSKMASGAGLTSVSCSCSKYSLPAFECELHGGQRSAPDIGVSLQPYVSSGLHEAAAAPILKVKRLPGVLFDLPTYETAGSSGFDLRANIDRTTELGPGNNYTIGTGFAFEIPEGYELHIRPRSGLTTRHHILCHFGTIDSDYRGEIKIALTNIGRTSYVVSPGDRIAQAVLVPVVKAHFEEVMELSKTERGTKGFGSTGK